MSSRETPEQPGPHSEKTENTLPQQRESNLCGELRFRVRSRLVLSDFLCHENLCGSGINCIEFKSNIEFHRQRAKVGIMSDIDEIFRQFRRNEDAARKFYEVETRILSILKFDDFFHCLLQEIQEKFEIPLAWICMIDKSEVSNLIDSIETCHTLRKHLTVVPRNVFVKLAGESGVPILINRYIKDYAALLPPSRTFLIRSMAIVPIMLYGQVVGSLNLADFAPGRFAPDLDSTLLERLGVKVSLCIANVTAHEKLRFLAFHDPLTGLLNRRVIEAILKREFTRARRYDGPLSMFFIDLDDFKGVNDRYGHDRGDDLLRHVADSLVELCRETDVVGRFAGDEFIVALPQTDKKSAEKLMRRIQKFCRKNPMQAADLSIPVSLSFGVACTEESGIDDSAALLKSADKRLYAAKARKTRKKAVTAS